MMINLNNYEEYFLLYIDNELSKEECAAVEAFALQHPHLAAELNMLKDTKLPIEEIVLFDDKVTLYKAIDSSININNYEEYFLLHTDKELSAKQEEDVEQFVLQHPQLQEEFLLLQKAKLTPENIIYPDKHRLYKQPAKRVIPLYVTRMAVAAAITGVVVLIGNLLINNGNQPQIAVITQHKEVPAVEKKPSLQQEHAVVSPEKKYNDVAAAASKIKEEKLMRVKSTEITSKVRSALASNQQSKTKATVEQIEPLQVKQAAPPAPEERIANNTAAPKQDVQTHAVTLKPLEEVNDKEAASTVIYASDEYATAQPAVYKELNTEEDDQSQTLYVGSLQLNKAKVNGLFKKAAHLLGSK